MTTLIILLIAAITHAGWNLIGKRQQPTPTFFLVAQTLGFVCLTPAIIRFWRIVPHISSLVWFLLFLTGLFQAIYYVGLSSAYRSGDMSVAYPIARSMPVILVAIITAVFVKDSGHLSSFCVMGIGIVIIGSLVLPKETFRDFTVKHYANGTCLFAMLAAVGTTGYSLVDSQALQILNTLNIMTGWKIALVYSFLEGFTTALFMIAYTLMVRKERQALLHFDKKSVGQAALTGVGIFVGYTLVLIAMALSTNIVYLMVLRQLSIPLGAVLGITVLGEPGYRPKYIGVTAMFIGIVIVAVTK